MRTRPERAPGDPFPRWGIMESYTGKVASAERPLPWFKVFTWKDWDTSLYAMYMLISQRIHFCCKPFCALNLVFHTSMGIGG